MHPTEAQRRNNRSKMRKISHEGRKTRNEKMLKELGWTSDKKEVHFQTAANDNLDRYSLSNGSQIESKDIEQVYKVSSSNSKVNASKTTTRRH